MSESSRASGRSARAHTRRRLGLAGSGGPLRPARSGAPWSSTVASPRRLPRPRARSDVGAGPAFAVLGVGPAPGRPAGRPGRPGRRSACPDAMMAPVSRTQTWCDTRITSSMSCSTSRMARPSRGQLGEQDRPTRRSPRCSDPSSARRAAGPSGDQGPASSTRRDSRSAARRPGDWRRPEPHRASDLVATALGLVFCPTSGDAARRRPGCSPRAVMDPKISSRWKVRATPKRARRRGDNEVMSRSARLTGRARCAGGR